MKQMKKTLCLFLALVMLLSLGPVSALATETEIEPPVCTEHVYGEDGLCTVCGAERPEETEIEPPVCTEHVYGEDGLCTVCGAEQPEETEIEPPVCTEHVYGEDGLCTVCGAEQPEETEIEPPVCTEHVYGEDGLCTVCGAEQPEETGDDSSTPAEASAQNDGEVEYPMQSFNFRADAGTEITVDAPEGAFPEDTRMTVTEADLAEVQALIDADEELEGTVLAAVDISFYYHDEPIQPRVPVRVSYASAAAAEAVEPKVVHIADDDSIDVLDEVTAETVEAESMQMMAMSGFGAAAETPASTEMLKLSFRAGSFSRYAILGAAKAPAAPVLLLTNDNDNTTDSTGSLTISTGDFTRGQTTYVMRDDINPVDAQSGERRDANFTVSLSLTGSNYITDRVLVIEIPQYGATFRTIPGTTDTIRAVRKINDYTLALQLNNPGAQSFGISIPMKHVALSNAQMADIIANDFSTTYIRATEYAYSGNLNSFTYDPDSGYLHQDTYCAMTPTWTDEEVKFTHNYNWLVSAIPEITNFVLGAGYSGPQGGALEYYFNTPNVGGLRLRVPTPYAGLPVEITSVKLYVPDSRLVLKGIYANSSRSRNWGNYLMGSDFSSQQTGWTWQKDEDGSPVLSDEHGYYYLLTPPSGTHYYNNYAVGSSDEHFMGFGISWVLKSGEALDPDSVYQGYSTEITYKVPGGAERTITAAEGNGDNGTYCPAGPRVATRPQETRTIGHKYNASRSASTWYPGGPSVPGNQNVIVGMPYSRSWFNSVCNTQYRSGSIDYLPEYQGEVTQSYEFPFQIQPTTMYISQDLLRKMVTVNNAQLASVKYITWDGTEHYATDEEIDAINDNYLLTNSAAPGTLGTVSFTGASATNPVRKVILSWDHLARTACSNLADAAVANISFDFSVTDYTGPSPSERLSPYTQVQVLYRESYDGTYNNGETYKPDTVNASIKLPGQESPSTQSVEQYLWFRLIPQLDPDLYGKGYYNLRRSRPLPKYWDGSYQGTLGHLGFYVGDYGQYRDSIHDPVITLWMEYLPYNNQYHPSGTFSETTAEQMMCFLNGKFTAMPRLNDMYFEYTTVNADTHAISSHRYPAEGGFAGIPEEGRAEQIPLGANEYFASLQLCYDGDLDLSHESYTVEDGVIWLMKDVGWRSVTVNPWTGKSIRVLPDYGEAAFDLTGKVVYSDCVCGPGYIHANGQAMKYYQTDGPYCYLVDATYSTRKGTLYVSYMGIPSTPTVYQGATFTTSLNIKNLTSVGGTYDFASAPGAAFSQTGYPYDDVCEAVWFELTDPELVPIRNGSTLYGVSATDPNVDWDIVSVEGRSFLKMQFNNKDYIRPRVWNTQSGGSWGGGGFVGNPTWYQLGNRTPAGECIIKFQAVSGAREGDDHHPIGDVYLDFSNLLLNYRAGDTDADGKPITTGYDLERTKYLLGGPNVVEDTLGLSDTAATGPKLFYFDGSSYKVIVEFAKDTGVDMVPGKQTNQFDANPRITEYRSEDLNDLNALVSFTGSSEADNPEGADPGNANTVYDMTATVVLPRAGKTIVSNSNEGPVSSTGEVDFFLRGAPVVQGNNTGGTVTWRYTTATDPLSASAVWTETAPTTPEGWNAVTGVQITVSEVPPKKSANVRLDLRSNAKDSLDVLHAYGGGEYTYKTTPDGTPLAPLTLPLNEWVYENYSISSGRVFWDVYDENGVKGGNAGQNWNGENLISGLKVWLYDKDGNVIKQPDGENLVDFVTTNAAGQFPTLLSYTDEAEQYILLQLPDGGTDVTVKPTKQSTSAIRASGVDSDFPRDVVEVEGVKCAKLLFSEALTGNYTNVSAGFVKLPEIGEIEDVTIPVGQTVDNIAAVLREYVSNTSDDANNILTNGGYRIDFSVPEGSDAIATLSPSAIEKQDNDHIRSLLSVTGVAPGSFLCTVTGKNSLGDEVSTTFTVTVVPNVFYVYHSSSGVVDTISMTDPRFTDAGKFDLTVLTAGGHRYGGYYNAFADLDASCFTGGALNAGKTLRTYTGDKAAYSGLKSYWKSANAITSEPGNAMTPVVGGLYFLKEVPEKYLCSRIQYVYDWNQGNKLNSIYLLTAVDDKLYENVGFDVVVVDTDVKYATLAGSFTFKPRNTDSYIQTKVTDFAGVARGYVGFVDGGFATTDGFLSANMQFSMTPFWTTPDGVKVCGAARSFNTGDGTCDSGTGIHEVTP